MFLSSFIIITQLDEDNDAYPKLVSSTRAHKGCGQWRDTNWNKPEQLPEEQLKNSPMAITNDNEALVIVIIQRPLRCRVAKQWDEKPADSERPLETSIFLLIYQNLSSRNK